MEQLESQPDSPINQVIGDLQILNQQEEGRALPEAVLTGEDWAAYYAEIERIGEAHRIDPKDRNIRLR